MAAPPLKLQTLFLSQLAGAALLSLPTLLLGGFCAAWIPPIGTMVAAFAVFFFYLQRNPGGLSRVAVRRLALGSGGLHALLATAGYGAAVLSSPESFSFQASAALVLAPVLGIAAGGVAAVLTLCAGDGAASTAGGWPN